MSRSDFINVNGCHLEKNSGVCSFQEILYDLLESSRTLIKQNEQSLCFLMMYYNPDNTIPQQQVPSQQRSFSFPQFFRSGCKFDNVVNITIEGFIGAPKEKLPPV